MFTSWWLIAENSQRSIGGGDVPASNLNGSGNDESGKLDPLPSGFWKRPTGIATQNLAAGFGRAEIPRFDAVIWNYAEPKTSSGTRAGLEIKAEGREYKIKFAEVNSEPFTARMFDALGFHADPTDFVPELRIRYSRRFFREFNLRKPIMMRIRPFWIPLAAVNLQPHHNPFQFVKLAVFKDGRKIPGAELKRLLLVDPSGGKPEEPAENYRRETEAELDYLVVGPVNIQPEDESTESIGCWDFSGLGHENLRELRGAGLLAGWLGWFDSRFDNTRLRVTTHAGSDELQFFFTDLGSGMGGGKGWLIRHGENPDAFEDSFTDPEIVRGPGRMTTPFRIRNFETIVPTPAFQRMTIGDARWMGRLIAQLTETQIRDALLASGYDSATAAKYLEKLLHRRAKMLRDLGLANELHARP
ncbi:MAG TPA: hypothetical protein VK327_10140 [Candidatus Paceibacterota bacterium]|nr:hypothetical protein [Candidatus Paceibacterota bacterium]